MYSIQCLWPGIASSMCDLCGERTLRPTKSCYIGNGKRREVSRRKKNWRQCGCSGKGGGGDGQLRSVFVNRVCGKTTNTRFPTNLEFWAFVKRVSYMHGLVGGAKQDFVQLGRFSGLWRSRSVCSPYPNNA
uniref:Uncharacterized protein n=1 Tax=Triticum urartu TaxID=4572 RepID=A0A8R7TXZ8_TRIUA